MNIDFTQNENNTVVTAYVFPDSVRYFALAPEYFYGVRNMAIAVCKPDANFLVWVTNTN